MHENSQIFRIVSCRAGHIAGFSRSGRQPCAADDCSTTYYSATDFSGSSATLTPTSLNQTLSFTAQSATVTAGCSRSVNFRDSQLGLTATIAPGGSNSGFTASTYMALMPTSNHNEALLVA